MTSKYTINDIMKTEALATEAIGIAVNALANASRREKSGEILDWMIRNCESLLASEYGSIGELESITKNNKNAYILVFANGSEVELKPIHDEKTNVLYAFDYNWHDKKNVRNHEIINMSNEILNLVPHGEQVHGKYQIDYNDILSILQAALTLRKNEAEHKIE